MKGQGGCALQGGVIAYALDGEALIDSIVKGQDEPYCAYRRVACAVEQQAMGGMTIERVLLQPVGMIRLALKRMFDAINLIANLLRYRDQLAAGGVDRFEMEVEETQKVSLAGLEQRCRRRRSKLCAFGERVFGQTHSPTFDRNSEQDSRQLINLLNFGAFIGNQAVSFGEKCKVLRQF